MQSCSHHVTVPKVSAYKQKKCLTLVEDNREKSNTDILNTRYKI